jgi:hypothetical protein
VQVELENGGAAGRGGDGRAGGSHGAAVGGVEEGRSGLEIDGRSGRKSEQSWRGSRMRREKEREEER